MVSKSYTGIVTIMILNPDRLEAQNSPKVIQTSRRIQPTIILLQSWVQFTLWSIIDDDKRLLFKQL